MIKSVKVAVLLMAVIVFLTYSCNNKEEEKKENKVGEIVVLNPNGMSEMSIIMEEWYQVMLKYSKQLKDNYTITNFETIRQKDIYKAKTSKENVHSNQFNAFVEGYFYNFNEIENTISFGEQVAQFNLAVKSCINCHEQYCHGPIVRIQKLLVSN